MTSFFIKKKNSVSNGQSYTRIKKKINNQRPRYKSPKRNSQYWRSNNSILQKRIIHIDYNNSKFWSVASNYIHNTLKVSHFHIQPYPKQPITIQKPNQQSTKRKKISILAILITSRSLLSVGANPKQLSAIQTPINCQKQEKKFFFF